MKNDVAGVERSKGKQGARDDHQLLRQVIHPNASEYVLLILTSTFVILPKPCSKIPSRMVTFTRPYYVYNYDPGHDSSLQQV